MLHRQVLNGLTAAMFLVLFVGTANAAINIANGAPIIGGSGDYDGLSINSGSFPTSNVTNGVNAAPDNDSGTISELYGDGSYWLGHNFQSTGYFVLDLGAAYNIGQIVLFNTHNGQFQDRGTGDFAVSGSLLTTPGPGGFDLLGGVQIAAGTLSPESPSNPTLTPQSFSATNAGPFRYIRFDALSIGAIGIPYGLNGVGLNEIRINEASLVAVPEPSILLVFGLVGGLGWALRWRLSNALSG